MKSFSSLKSLALISAVVLFLASCSNERYGSIQRGNVKAKEIAKVENSTPAASQVNTTEATETPALTEVGNTLEIAPAFNADQAVKTVEQSNVSKQVTTKSIAKMFKNNSTFVPNAKITAPFTIAKALKHSGSNSHAIEKIVLILLAILIPPVAVGIVSDWDDTNAIILNLVLTILCWIPGIIHAIIYVNKNS